MMTASMTRLMMPPATFAASTAFMIFSMAVISSLRTARYSAGIGIMRVAIRLCAARYPTGIVRMAIHLCAARYPTGIVRMAIRLCAA